MLRLFATLAFVGSLVSGCGPGRGTQRWIGDDAAAVRCVVAGHERPTPILLEVPVPLHPTGLYARLLDPVGLDKMGYQRDQPVCATLVAPTPERVAAAQADLQPILEVQKKAGDAALSVSSRCVCEVAKELGLVHLVAACSVLPAVEGCEVDQATAAGVSEALAPLQQQLAEATMIPVHWRLSGLTDRPDWFAEKLPDLLKNHGAGSDVFLPGNARPSRGNHLLIRALLDAEDVVAVVRQDGGAALLVAREVDGRELVLDHFRHTVYDARARGLLAEWDNTHVQYYLDQLRPPAVARAPLLDVRLGNIVELRADPLERIDQGLVATSRLSMTSYNRRKERRREPPVYVDRLTVQAPSVRPGVLVGIIELNEAGRNWAAVIPEVVLTPTLEEFEVSDVEPSIAKQKSPPFVMRGTAVWRASIHGIHAFVRLMRKVEIDHPSTIGGKPSRFTFDLPTAPLSDTPDPGLAELAERLASAPHRLSGSMSPARDMITFELAPR